MSSSELRLPDGWTPPDFVEDEIVADGVVIRRAGVSSIAPDGEEVCGAAAHRTDVVRARASFELLERVAAVESLSATRESYTTLDRSGRPMGELDRATVFPESEAPDRWRYARSNGVAIHAGWAAACDRARWELAERDRVLRSWRGEIIPEALPWTRELTLTLGETHSYDWRVFSFPDDGPSSFAADVHVTGVFGFPRTGEPPFVLGLAGRPERAAATTAAAEEALQLLAFLWGEPAPIECPSQPLSAAAHLDAFQVKGAHARIRGWLEGGHARYGDKRRRRAGDNVSFVDLTPRWMADGCRVAKAICREAMPLAFGVSPWTEHLPDSLRLHPIP
jgi:hypothetical protein